MRFHQLHNTTCEEHNPGKSLPNPITLLATFEDLKKTRWTSATLSHSTCFTLTKGRLVSLSSRSQIWASTGSPGGLGKIQMVGPQCHGFWLTRSKVEPENLHSSGVSWCCSVACRWSTSWKLLTRAMALNSACTLTSPGNSFKCRCPSHTLDISNLTSWQSDPGTSTFRFPKWLLCAAKTANGCPRGQNNSINGEEVNVKRKGRNTACEILSPLAAPGP